MKKSNFDSLSINANDEIITQMLNKALEAKNNAYVKYSGFPIGVSILTKDGNIVTGFNIENASYSLTICAERAAFASFLTQGYKTTNIDKILVVGDVDAPISPCGACREFMSEFIHDNVEIILVGKKDKIKTSINELLPHRFTKQFTGLSKEG